MIDFWDSGMNLYLSFIVAFVFLGTYKVRNEIETKRNEIDENETKRNQQKRNEINEMKTK